MTSCIILGPYLSEKPGALDPVLALGPSLTAPASHSPVHVPLPWCLKPNPSITAPANPGPTPSASANSSPTAAPASLSPPGPAHRVAYPQYPGTTPPGVAAIASGNTVYPLVARATSMVNQISQAICLLTYRISVQQLTIPAPLRSAGHPATALLNNYASNGFPVEVVPEWSLTTIRNSIKKGTHSSTLSPESTASCRGGVLERTQRGFSIILTEEDAMVLF